MKKTSHSSQVSLFDLSDKTGIPGSGRIHESIVNVEIMTPEENKNKGQNLIINHSFSACPFGKVLIASTPKGICYLGFSDDDKVAFSELKNRFPNAYFTERSDAIQENAQNIYSKDWTEINKIKLHLKGTDFQHKVWETLLKIPTGSLTTYCEIAELILKPKAARAVGTAIGSNPIAFIIPCHRVIQASGGLGGYMWGESRKAAIIDWEVAERQLYKNKVNLVK